MGKLIVSLSPHAHGNDSVERNMYGVIIALIPAVLVSLYYFGIGSAVVLLTSVAACVFFEWAIAKYMLKTKPQVLDGSAMLTGLLLGMNLPSNLPLWIIILGALIAIGVGKMSLEDLVIILLTQHWLVVVFFLLASCADDKLAYSGTVR